MECIALIVDPAMTITERNYLRRPEIEKKNKDSDPFTSSKNNGCEKSVTIETL